MVVPRRWFLVLAVASAAFFVTTFAMAVLPGDFTENLAALAFYGFLLSVLGLVALGGLRLVGTLRSSS